MNVTQRNKSKDDKNLKRLLTPQFHLKDLTCTLNWTKLQRKANDGHVQYEVGKSKCVSITKCSTH